MLAKLLAYFTLFIVFQAQFFRFNVTMARALFEKTGKKNCMNCLNYDWEQPEDETTIQQCARCKGPSYCSRQCQEEHWHNLHKQHCKYMAKEKVLPKSRHDKATCLVSNEVTAAGLVEILKPTNPVLPCTMALVKGRV